MRRFARPTPHGARPAGFTLVELLIVVGIAAVLISALLPALAAARGAAAQVRCAANLRQWTAAANQYAVLNHNFLPRRGQGVEETTQFDRDADWFNALPPLLGMAPYRALVASRRAPDWGLWACPLRAGSASAQDFTYGMNMWLSTWSAPLPDRIDRTGDPGTMVFMADGPAGHCSVVPADAPYSPVPRHRRRVNLAFLDGHVDAFAGDYVGCGAADPHRLDVRWVVPNSAWRGPH